VKLFERFRAPRGATSRDDGRVVKANARRVRKAVFPVAGFGTRFLPATKAVPKEMLPIVDRPLIQYAVDEAIAAGIEEMIFVTHRTKRAIEDHFDRAAELEGELEKGGKESTLQELRRVAPPHVRFSFARQTAPLGLGHAVWCARHLIGDEPFAVMLPDDLIAGDPPVLAQMIETFQRSGASVIAVENVKREDTSRYGIVEPALDGATRLTRILGIVEKPAPEKAPSTMAVVGRYVFSPRLLDCLENLEPGSGNEIQLTDGIARLLASEPVFAYSYLGKRYDCGSKLGFLEATLDFALKHPQLGADFQQLVNRAADAHAQDDATGQGVRGSRHLTLVSS
jgi:UTP--glucose-1-phosphate uridylyltransferase